MPNTEKASPVTSDTKTSQLILKVAGIIAAVGLLGGVTRDAVNNWTWTKEIYVYLFPQTLPDGTRIDAEQRLIESIDNFLKKTGEQKP